MKTLRRIVNPLMAFIGIQLAWGLVVIFWISWFLKSQSKLRVLAEKYHPELLQGKLDWLVLTEGLVLLVAILVGVYVIFLYWRRQATLYRAQKQFISQMSHEFKSPLASLQLHLETIRLRRPDARQLENFLDTMQDDTTRLHNMVNNLLTANRLEQKWPRLELRPGNLSLFITRYLQRQRDALGESTLDMDIEPGLWCRFEPAALETVLRNLLENAVLYSDAPARIRVVLHAEGARCHLSVADRGRGITRKEHKKVFRMFYRGRHHGETIRGTGLGLFIVRAVVWRHKGKIWLRSDAPEPGTTVHILLPRLSGQEMKDNR
jgi:hypothetical protein